GALDEVEAGVREEVQERRLAEQQPVEDAHPPALREELLNDVRPDVAAATHHEDVARPAAQDERPHGLHQPAFPMRPAVRPVAVAMRGAGTVAVAVRGAVAMAVAVGGAVALAVAVAVSVAVHDVCSLVASHPKIAATVRAIRRRSRPRLRCRTYAWLNSSLRGRISCT